MPKKLTKEEFIYRANEKHNFIYKYDDIIYINSKTKISILCPYHGIFKQTPSAHISKTQTQGCPKCGRLKVQQKLSLTTEEFIKRAKKIHGNKYDYSLVDYKNAHTKVKIICKRHGIFHQLPSTHLNGSDHPNEKINKIIKKTSLTTEEFIKRSKKIYGNKYDYSLVDYKNAHTKVKIIDKQNNIIFEQRPNDHLRGKEYIKYRGDKISNALSLTTEEFIKRAKKIHGNKYDYSLVDYKNNSTKVKIIDKQNNIIFEQRPNNHINNKGYRIKITTEEFIKRAKKIHGNKYDYSLVDYKNNSTKVKIICKEHRIFKQTPAEHYKGGCNKCANKKRATAARNNPSGWGHNKWQEIGEKSNVFDSFKVYILKIWDENEQFFKIGKTFKEINKRFNCYNKLPYKWELIQVYTSNNAKEISILEKKLQNINIKYKYLPLKSFNGCFECFSTVIYK